MIAFRPPKIDSSSSILNADQWMLMTLSLPIFQNKDLIDKLYDKLTKGSSFNRIANELLGYSSSTLFVFHHEQNDQKYLMASFMSQPFQDILAYQGDAECVLLSIYPQFHIYRAKNPDNG